MYNIYVLNIQVYHTISTCYFILDSILQVNNACLNIIHTSNIQISNLSKIWFFCKLAPYKTLSELDSNISLNYHILFFVALQPLKYRLSFLQQSGTSPPPLPTKVYITPITNSTGGCQRLSRGVFYENKKSAQQLLNNETVHFALLVVQTVLVLNSYNTQSNSLSIFFFKTVSVRSTFLWRKLVLPCDQISHLTVISAPFLALVTIHSFRLSSQTTTCQGLNCLNCQWEAGILALNCVRDCCTMEHVNILVSSSVS